MKTRYRAKFALGHLAVPCALAVGVLFVEGAAAAPVADQLVADTPADLPGEQQLAQTTPVQLTPAPGLIPSAQPPLSADTYAKADQLKIRGWVIPTPGAVDTLDQGAFGLRNALADLGISYLGIYSATFYDNLLRHGLPAGNSRDAQQYAGQLPTYLYTLSQYVMYDLRRFGIPDGQLALGGWINSTNWNPLGPDQVVLSTASYYQTLFNKKVEFKIGYFGNSYEYLSTYVGGSLASGIFGPEASLPFENGENANDFVGPAVNVKIYLPDHFYTKFGAQRADSPDSYLVERAQNKSAVQFLVPKAGLFAIDEIGYHTLSTPGNLSTWVRFAANYTSSRYKEILNPEQRTSPDYGFYLLGDQQLVQFAPHAGPGSATRGIYAGFSAEYTPQNINTFTQYYELRLYSFGLIPGRPTDLTSLVATHDVFSDDAIQITQAEGLRTHRGTSAITLSYGYRLFHGVTVNGGVSFTDHPTAVGYTGSTGSAFNLLLNAFVAL